MPLNKILIPRENVAKVGSHGPNFVEVPLIKIAVAHINQGWELEEEWSTPNLAGYAAAKVHGVKSGPLRALSVIDTTSRNPCTSRRSGRNQRVDSGC